LNRFITRDTWYIRLTAGALRYWCG